MCGLFGYIGNSPDMDLIKAIGLGAAERGFHGHGIACLRKGYIISHKATTDLSKDIDILDITKGSKIIIGNCRLATSGSRTLSDAQPILNSELAVVHNGNVHNYSNVYKVLDYKPLTQSDSEAVLAIMSGKGALALSSFIDSPYAIMALRKKSLLIASKGLPLYYMEDDTGIYFCSKRINPTFERFKGKFDGYSTFLL